MKNEDISKMQKYGITCEQVNIYHYKQYQYANLQDAIKYAKLDGDFFEENLPLKVEGKKRSSKSGKDES